MLLLVPADPLRPRRADQHFAPEAAAARGAGLTVALVDHDALQGPGGADQAVAAVPADGEAIYRGWMLSSEQYGDFAAALARRDVTLRTNPQQYRRAHELPGWYQTLVAVTPESVWTAGSGRAEFQAQCAVLGSGPAVLRDYVKSMKHYWEEAMFVPDVADTAAAWRVARRFLELRDDDFAGGLVLRRFERFTSAEVRTWWVDGRCVLVGPHPDTPDRPPQEEVDLTQVAARIRLLNLPFVTVDLARRSDGVWRVVELGDGQVSDRPATVSPDRLLSRLTGHAATTSPTEVPQPR